MTRTYRPRQSRTQPMRLVCDDCTVTVAAWYPPSPDLDDGWPLHRCYGHRCERRPFSRAVSATSVEAA